MYLVHIFFILVWNFQVISRLGQVLYYKKNRGNIYQYQHIHKHKGTEYLHSEQIKNTKKTIQKK